MDTWIETAIGKMHINKITQIELADYLGVTNDYVSMILKGALLKHQHYAIYYRGQML